MCVLLTAGEWHEVQLAQPQVGVFIVSDDVAPTLSMLVRASREYLLGRHKVLRERGLFRSTDTVVLETEEGEWRLGRRRSRLPA